MPSNAVRDVAHQVIREVRSNPPLVTTADDAALFLRNTVSYFRTIISPSHLERLEQTDIYVVLKPICNAYANNVDGSIVIFDGLLKALIFRMEISLLIARVQKHFDVVSAKSGMSAKDFRDIAFSALSLSLHFLNHPNTLPRLQDHFDEDLKRDARIAFGGGLLFILFHELGHLVLGHGVATARGRLRNVPALAYSETMNLGKEQEFEADAFAFEAILPEVRTAVIVNVWYIMIFFLDFEVFVSGSAPAHPFSINRVGRLNDISGALSDPVIGPTALRMFEQRLELMSSAREEPNPQEDLLPPATVAKIREDDLFTAIGTESNARSAVEKLLAAYRAIG